MGTREKNDVPTRADCRGGVSESVSDVEVSTHAAF